MIRYALLALPVLGVLLVDLVPPDFHAIKYAGLMAGAIACVALALRAGGLAWSRVGWALWVFVGVRAVLLLSSPMSGEAVRWWSLLLALAVVHQIAVALPSRRWLRRNAPRWMAALLCATALLALVQWLSGERQAHAFFANRNFAGVGLAMLLPYALATRWRWPLLIVGIVGLAAIHSRGGALAAAAALGLWLTWRRPRWRWPLVAGAVVVVAVLGLAMGERNTVKARGHWYRSALQLGMENPVLGLGTGGFEREYPPVRPLEEYSISGGDRVHAVHNDYLESFAEGGILGLGAHLWLLVAAAFAVRRHRAAAASLLAFAAGSLVDLPLRDPSLLAIAFLGLMIASPRTRRRGRGWLAYAAALVVIALFFPLHWHHWRADRLFGRYLERHESAVLDAVLRIERRHPEALIERAGERDLALLLEQLPHDARALSRLTRAYHRERAIAALEEILERHDPHDPLTRVRLARLLKEEDPIRAASLLEGAVAANRRLYQPYLELASIHRATGDLRAAEDALRQAEDRRKDIHVVRERLELELARLRGGRLSAEALAYAVSRLPAREIEERVADAFARAREIEEADPPRPVDRKEGETVDDHLERIRKAKDAWRARLDPLTRPHYYEAFLLAEGLVAAHPGAPHLRLQARAARGLRDAARARKLESMALLLEALEELLRDDEHGARKSVRRALLAYPELGQDRDVRDALRLFLRTNPNLRLPLRRICAGDAALSDAIGE